MLREGQYCVCVCVCLCACARARAPAALMTAVHRRLVLPMRSLISGTVIAFHSRFSAICRSWTLRCHYTKSNPIDDHSNISSKKVTEAKFQTIGPLYLHAVWYFPFTNSPRKHTVTYHFSDLQEVYSGNRQIHTKCQLKYFHPPHISTRGKCHCNNSLNNKSY